MTPVPAVRLAVGYAAVATVPYLTLEVVRLLGGTVGPNDPGLFADHPAHAAGNLLTVGMDVAAVPIALA